MPCVASGLLRYRKTGVLRVKGGAPRQACRCCSFICRPFFSREGQKEVRGRRINLCKMKRSQRHRYSTFERTPRVSPRMACRLLGARRTLLVVMTALREIRCHSSSGFLANVQGGTAYLRLDRNYDTWYKHACIARPSSTATNIPGAPYLPQTAAYLPHQR